MFIFMRYLIFLVEARSFCFLILCIVFVSDCKIEAAGWFLFPFSSWVAWCFGKICSLLPMFHRIWKAGIRVILKEETTTLYKVLYQTIFLMVRPENWRRWSEFDEELFQFGGFSNNNCTQVWKRTSFYHKVHCQVKWWHAFLKTKGWCCGDGHSHLP